MDVNNFVAITQMRESHLREVFELSQENNLSYWSFEDYKAEISREDSLCLVAEHNDRKEVAGFLVSRLIMLEDYGELYNIAVKNQYKRKAIGKNLLLHLINQCVINKLVRINLEVRQSNQTALNFYSKLNFKPVGIRKNFYTEPPENAVTMVINLDKKNDRQIKNLIPANQLR